MGKLEERENRRRASVVGSMVDGVSAVAGGKKGRPKEDRETKKRVSLSVMPSLYEDIQKIAYVQRRSVSEMIECLLLKYREDHSAELSEYERIKKNQ